MEADILSAGVNLMLVGVGAVLVFLSILVGATKLMSHLVMRFLTETGDLISEAEEVAAVAAAVTRYRQEH